MDCGEPRRLGLTLEERKALAASWRDRGITLQRWEKLVQLRKDQRFPCDSFYEFCRLGPEHFPAGFDAFAFLVAEKTLLGEI